MSSRIPVHLVIAMGVEARPLVEHLALAPQGGEGPFRVFASPEVRLVVSGVGRVAAAAAAGYLFALERCPRHRPWLNVGVAGHASRPLGSAVLAHKIVEPVCPGTEPRAYYPPVVFPSPVPTETVMTVDQVQYEYTDDAAYDMEASAFFATAARFSTAELVQVLKIVSDNRTASPDQLDAGRVEALVRGRLAEIEAVVRALQVLAAELPPPGADPDDVALYLGRWRFTVTERRQLDALLRRWRTLAPRSELWHRELEGLRAAADVLRHLERTVAALALERGPAA